MDTELAEKLTELTVGMTRIDERTKAIHASQEKLGKTFEAHEERDRVDFKTVNGRITKVSNKQNWMLGAGSIASVGAAAWITNLIRNAFLGG